jgi:hypothetical protein
MGVVGAIQVVFMTIGIILAIIFRNEPSIIPTSDPEDKIDHSKGGGY